MVGDDTKDVGRRLSAGTYDVCDVVVVKAGVGLVGKGKVVGGCELVVDCLVGFL